MESGITEEDLRSEEEDLTQGNPINDIQELLRQEEALKEGEANNQGVPVKGQIGETSSMKAESKDGNVTERHRNAIPVEVIVERGQYEHERPKRRRLENDGPPETGQSAAHSSGSPTTSRALHLEHKNPRCSHCNSRKQCHKSVLSGQEKQGGNHEATTSSSNIKKQ